MAQALFQITSWHNYLCCEKIAAQWRYFTMSKKAYQACQSENEKNIPILFKSNFTSANQKRATFVVLVIATSFAVFQLPSAIVYIWELYLQQNGKTAEATSKKLFVTIATLANSLVVSSKMTNFFLFCMSR